ncbi:MAG: hypothetical protein U0414_42070 [Polyangiaceae bacterium]
MGKGPDDSGAAFEGLAHPPYRTSKLSFLIAMEVCGGLFAALTGVITLGGRKGQPLDRQLAWMPTAFPFVLGSVVLLTALIVWYVRSTRYKLTVRVVPPVYELAIASPVRVEARGPFRVERRFAWVRNGRTRNLEAQLAVWNESGPVVLIQQTIGARRLPENWTEGPVRAGSVPEVELGEGSIIELADRLAAGARGAVIDDQVERFAALLNSSAKQPKKKVKKSAKKAKASPPAGSD